MVARIRARPTERHPPTRSGTCHRTQVNKPHLTPAKQATSRPTRFTYGGGMEVRVRHGAGYKPK